MTVCRFRESGNLCPSLRGLLAVLAALLGSSAYSQADPNEPVQKPEVRVGDSWTYNYLNNWRKVVISTYKTTVTFVGPDSILTEQTFEGKEREDDGSWTSEWNARTLSRGSVFQPHQTFLSFPLKVGDAYQTMYERVGIRGRPAVSLKFQQLVRVMGWEDVSVPAGKFRALRIEANGKFQQLETGSEGWTRTVIWYVPEVERWVRFTYEDGTSGPRVNEGHELVEFKLVEKPK